MNVHFLIISTRITISTRHGHKSVSEKELLLVRMEVRKITFSLRVPKKINLSGFVVNTAQYKNKSRDYSY
jgi:hypothetical protein